MTGKKLRKPIHYTLILLTLVSQMTLLWFLHHEYFNEKSLSAIKSQMEEIQSLRRITNLSKQELLQAQGHLQNYLNQYQNNHLALYFQSLRRFTAIIDSAQLQIKIVIPPEEEMMLKKSHMADLRKIEMMIDSLHHVSAHMPIQFPSLQVEKYEVHQASTKVERNETHVMDSMPKKRLFSRLRDAFKGKVEVKTDTVYIFQNHFSILDTTSIKSEMDSTISAINSYYLAEIGGFKNHLSSIQDKNYNVYSVYNNLISLSNCLIDLYDDAVSDVWMSLDNQYNEKYSQNEALRQKLIIGIIVFMVFVVLLIAFFTWLSFVDQRKLSQANHEISQNLMFKNRVLSMISHEMRSPLKIISLLADKILNQTTNFTSAEYLNSMKLTSQSLVHQANQILEFAKNPTQAPPVKLQPIPLRGTLERYLKIFTPFVEAAHNQLQIINNIDDDLMVDADLVKLQQLLTNLIVNANKFTEEGTIVVTLHTLTKSGQVVQLIVSVVDTGFGISENDIKNIFQPYYQGVVSSQVENLGVGLGLSLCKEIVSQLDGVITANSRVGEGTTIEFKINLKIAS